MPADTGSIHVLHVDDEVAFGSMAGEFLREADDRFEVTTAEDADSGLDQLDRLCIDCVVSDFDMPGRNGIEFLKVVREAYPDLPFILFTGEGSESVASDAISAGVTDYLQKGGPDQFTLLANRIVNAVEQRRAEAAATRTQQRLRELSENTNDVLWMFDRDWSELLFINSAYEPIWGRSVATLREQPRDFLEGIHPDDRQRVEDAMARLTGGETVDLEYRVNEAEEFGRTVWVQASPITENGEVRRIVGFARDVTDRKARERRFRTLHETARELAACESSDEVYELLVDGAQHVLEYDLVIADNVEGDQLVPRAIATSVTNEGYFEAIPIDADANLAARAYRTGEASLVDDLHAAGIDPADQSYQSALTVPIGDHGIFQAVSRKRGEFSDADRELVETLVSHAQTTLDRLDRDRSLRERSEELEEQNERLEEFASLISHDLRNPLNVAQGHLDLAQEEGDSDHLAEVAVAHDRMDALIDEVLSLAREGGTVEEPEPVDLAGLVEDCWRTVATGALQLTVETEAVIMADRARLRQFLENLFRNAVEHGGAEVTVGSLPDGFYVEDDGPGVPPSEREKVFETGYTADSEGIGLGLSIARQIALEHGWQLTVDEGPGGGARFEVREATVR